MSWNPASARRMAVHEFRPPLQAEGRGSAGRGDVPERRAAGTGRVPACSATLGLILVCLLNGKPAAAQDASGLFSCRVVVTGTDMRERPAALERCVRNVVVKVTGKPLPGDDARVVEIAGHADRLVEDIVYLDRMTDIPRHDEQGSRDRPFDLVAHVDPEGLRAELAAAGLKPWLDRPTLLAAVQVSKGAERFRLTADGLPGERQRRALLAAGDAYGMRVSLLTERQTEASTGAAPDPGSLKVSGGTGKVVVLSGMLRWSDADFGWNAEWRLNREGTERAWSISGVSFDEAFRSGVGGAAAALSGPE